MGVPADEENKHQGRRCLRGTDERRMIMPKNVVCKKCNNLVNGWCEKVIDSPDPHIARDCPHFREKTNADRIREMSDEELAVWLVEKTVYQESAFTYPTYLNFLTESDDTKEGAIKGTVDWLQQPANDGGNYI